MRTRLVMRLQRNGNAGKRAAGADRAGKAVDFAVGLPPDFLARCFDVALPVGYVIKLIGPDRAVLFGSLPIARRAGRRFLRSCSGLEYGTAGTSINSAPQSRSVSFFSLLCVSGMTMTLRKPMALPTRASPIPVLPAVPSTISAAGPQRALLDRVLDDEESGAVLDRLARIHEFGLAEDIAAGRSRDAVKAD